jgi:HlyD family secretion protein
MKRLYIAVAGIGVAVAGGIAWYHQRADAKDAVSFTTAAVTRASLRSTVSATGTLEAVRTVQVGTQASGQIAQINVDFNDHVKKGQLLARIDPTLQQQAVEDAQAQLERAQATLTQAQEDFTRNKQLVDARVLTQAEFETSQANFSVQEATVKSAQIALDRAKQNLDYTAIYSPIDGVIVERNVDVGQTVAASLSAPQLFLIANDLSDMQILAAVDESDIGQIKEGQSVQFTVQSYPNEHFTGTVKQVRLQSTTTDNVVNYTAVVAVKNDGGKLLPGMTATVQFTTASADNVLTVPNAALRVRPPGAPTTTTRPTTAAPPSGSAGSGSGRSSTSPSGQRTARTPGSTIWYVDDTKTMHPMRVTVGLSDGQRTEVSGPQVKEGTQVVVAVSQPGSATAGATGAPSTNPFQPQRPQGPLGGGGRGRGA